MIVGDGFFPASLPFIRVICAIPLGAGLISPLNLISRGTVPAADCEEADKLVLFEALESDCCASNPTLQSRLNTTVPAKMDL